MKSLYKKIGVGVLALALVLGGSLSQGAMINASSQSVQKFHSCKYQRKNFRPSNKYIDELLNKNQNDLEIVLKYRDQFNYGVDGVHHGHDEFPKAIYEDAGNFLSCVNEHGPQLRKQFKKLGQKKVIVGIGNWSYGIFFKEPK